MNERHTTDYQKTRRENQRCFHVTQQVVSNTISSLISFPWLVLDNGKCDSLS